MHKLIRIILDNPVSVLAIFLILLVSGIFAIPHLRFTLLPEFEDKFLEIELDTNTLPQEATEENLLEPIRQSMAIIPGVVDVYSAQFTGGAKVNLEISPESEIEVVQYLAQNVLNKIIAKQPDYDDKPLVKRALFNRLPLITLHITGEIGIDEISKISEDFIKKKLEQIEGVGFINIEGIQRMKFIVIPDLHQMARLKLDVAAFADLFRSKKSRTIEMKNSGSLMIGAKSELKEILDWRIKGIYRVSDLCKVEKEVFFPRGKSFFGHQPSVSISIFPRSGYSIKDTTKGIHTFISNFNRENKRIQIYPASDHYEGIKDAITLLLLAFIVALAGCMIVVFIITMDLKRSLLVSLCIPLSLIPIIGLFVLLNVEVHIFVLGGAVLGIGLLIDNAIIVTDELAIKRGIEDSRKTHLKRSLKAVAQPLIMATLTTLMAFVPVLFLHPLSYLLFHEQAFTLYAMLMSSLLVSLFILPLFYLRKSKKKPRRIRELREPLFLNPFLPRLTGRSPALIIVFHVTIFLFALWSFQKMELKVVPKVSFKGWDFISVNVSESNFRKLLSEAVLKCEHESMITGSYADGSDGKGNARIRIEYPYARVMPDTGLLAEHAIYRPAANPITWLFPHSLQEFNLRVYVNQEVPYPVQLRITGNKTDTVLRLIPQWDKLHKSAGSSTEIMNSMSPVSINENLVMKTVAEHDVPQIHLNNNAIIMLDRVTSVIPEIQSEQIFRDRRGEFFLVSGNLDKDSVMNRFSEMGYTVFDSEDSVRNNFRYVGIVSIVLTMASLYLLLMVQYRSFVWPFVIFISMPVSISGSLIALAITGEGLNMISLAGMVVGLGISVNDSILKVDTFRNYKGQGMEVIKAIEMTSRRRIQPIIITSLTTFAACLPMFMFDGMGNEIQSSMGIAILGGVVTSTISALFLIPIMIYAVCRLTDHTTDRSGIGMGRRLVGQ